MDKRNLRIGDYVKDPNNFGYTIKVGLDELRYSELFNPAPLYEEFFTKNGFEVQELGGETNYFLSKGPVSIRANRVDEILWSVSVRNLRDKRKFEGEIRAIHELQHATSDCLVNIPFLS